MARKGRRRLRRLSQLVAQAYPDLDPVAAIRRGRILVDGRPQANPDTLIGEGAAISLRVDAPLRGERKLRAAVDRFDVRVAGTVALDLGAAAGGFTRVLLETGAARVYAVDAGFGQLLGSLRQDPRVVNLERTNLAALSRDLVPDLVQVVTSDLSYVSLAEAIPQLHERVVFAPDADLVALVKPQFELGLPAPPGDMQRLERAVSVACRGIERVGWTIAETMRSPVLGARGSIEFFVHARRSAPAPKL